MSMQENEVRLMNELWTMIKVFASRGRDIYIPDDVPFKLTLTIGDAAPVNLASFGHEFAASRDVLLAKPIEELGLNTRSLTMLCNCGVQIIGSLARMSEEQVLKSRNLGKKSLRDIKEKLADLGLQLNLQDPIGPLERAGRRLETIHTPRAD